ncbi:MAG: hypothetical protein FWE01_02635 [Firmicutes bacterium]|nr:hypothetical protein [Bacillota bacterium]
MSVNWKKTFNLIAFIALVFIAISVLLSAVINAANVAQAFLTIALLLSVCVVAFYSFFFAYRGGDRKGRWTTKQVVYLCVWAVSFIIAIVGIILFNVL